MTTVTYVGKWADKRPKVVVLGKGEAYCLDGATGWHALDDQDFCWGLRCAGTLKLAAAILYDHAGLELHPDWILEFAEVLIQLPRGEDWKTTSDEIQSWNSWTQALNDWSDPVSYHWRKEAP